MFGKVKNNFGINQMVIIGNTTSEDLDGVEAQVIGIFNRDVSDTYILLLPHAINGHTGIVLTEVCLKAAKSLGGLDVFGHPVTC